MESKDLRVGNLVKLDGKQFKITIRSLFEGIILDVKPILITEKLLFNFGFELKGNNFLTKFTPVGKAIVFKDNYIIYTGITIETPIKYVHQLQNLYFTLTGEELVVSDAVS